MKKLSFLFLFVFVILLSFSCSQDFTYNLVGTWKVDVEMHSRDHGWIENQHEEGFVITEQKGHVFKGYKEYLSKIDNKRHKEEFSGTVSPFGDILIAEHVDGILFGEMKNRKKMVLQYAENGDIPKVQYLQLERVK